MTKWQQRPSNIVVLNKQTSCVFMWPHTLDHRVINRQQKRGQNRVNFTHSIITIQVLLTYMIYCNVYMYIYICNCMHIVYIYAHRYLHNSFRRNPDAADSLKAKGSVMGFGPWDALTLLRRWLPLVPSEGAGVIDVVDSSGSYYKYIHIYICIYIYHIISYHM